MKLSALIETRVRDPLGDVVRKCLNTTGTRWDYEKLRYHVNLLLRMVERLVGNPSVDVEFSDRVSGKAIWIWFDAPVAICIYFVDNDYNDGIFVSVRIRNHEPINWNVIGPNKYTLTDIVKQKIQSAKEASGL
jgi:hypothetical protein